MFPLVRTPEFSTTTIGSVSGREFRCANYAFPRVTYKLKYELLRDTAAATDFRTLAGFFNSRQGSFDTFLFNDADDNTATAQVFGIGDGTSKTFQLVRTLGGFVEPIYDMNSAPTIYVNGVAKALTTDYTINATGGVTFVAAPGAGLSITWTGTYYWRCRFVADSLDFEKFMNTFWQLGKVEFKVVKP